MINEYSGATRLPDLAATTLDERVPREVGARESGTPFSNLGDVEADLPVAVCCEALLGQNLQRRQGAIFDLSSKGRLRNLQIGLRDGLEPKLFWGPHPSLLFILALLAGGEACHNQKRTNAFVP